MSRMSRFLERNDDFLRRFHGEGPAKKSPDELTIAELFNNECPNGFDHRLQSNGECDVCGDAPTVQQVEVRRQWLRDHPNAED